MSEGKKRKASSTSLQSKTGASKKMFALISPYAAKAGSENSERVNPSRVRLLKEADDRNADGPVVYWMTRDHRANDNWGLLYAIERAEKRRVAVFVVFTLVSAYLNAGARQFGFMLRGLKKLQSILKSYNIPFFLLRGDPGTNICKFLEEKRASMVVMDFHPLRIINTWREKVFKDAPDFVAFYEVDSHNIIPALVASSKCEYSAKTLRSKIYKHLDEYLVEFPKLRSVDANVDFQEMPETEWDELIDEVLERGADVPEVDWLQPGEKAAMDALIGKNNGFLSSKRIARYAKDRNNPALLGGVSGLSPWLHFGHLSAQRCALEARKLLSQHREGVEAFLEELVVRSELADNFCHFQTSYDSLEGAWDWAKTTLDIHKNDERPFLYNLEQFEKGKTHDDLWNAAQLEMVYYGKMHGFMRMYWAKKILEWSSTPSEALSIAIYLNDKYELDGRDPNGYVGCMWSICGVHDQGWAERPVFGKIRYMNYAGCKRKFDVNAYIAYVSKLVKETKQRNKTLIFAQK